MAVNSYFSDWLEMSWDFKRNLIILTNSFGEYLKLTDNSAASLFEFLKDFVDKNKEAHK